MQSYGNQFPHHRHNFLSMNGKTHSSHRNRQIKNSTTKNQVLSPVSSPPSLWRRHAPLGTGAGWIP
uniref:Uncharacterized protein n=1 Tax=Arundo donax TaxID=35708 RepID=A0A0A9DTX5_ARUDO